MFLFFVFLLELFVIAGLMISSTIRMMVVVAVVLVEEESTYEGSW